MPSFCLSIISNRNYNHHPKLQHLLIKMKETRNFIFYLVNLYLPCWCKVELDSKETEVLSPSLIDTPAPSITDKETHLHFPDEPSIELDVGANLVLSNSNHDLFMMNFKCSSNDQSQIHWIECKIAIILKSQLCHVNSVNSFFFVFYWILADWLIFISCLSLSLFCMPIAHCP